MFAALLLIAFGLCLNLLLPNQNEADQRTAISHTPETNQPSGDHNTLAAVSKVHQGERPQDAPNEFDHGSEADWAMVRLTCVLAAIAAGQAILFFVQLRLMRLAANDAAVAAKAALDTATAAIAAQRPWLSVEIELDGDLVIGDHRSYWPGPHAIVPILAKIKNQGQTPAIGIQIDADIVFFDTKGRPFSAEDGYLQPFFDKGETATYFGSGISLFPGAEDELSAIASIAMKELKGRIAGADSDNVIAFIICSVTYPLT